MNRSDTAEQVVIEVDPGLVPLQQGAAPALIPPVVTPPGVLRSIAGLLGPDILLSSAANGVVISAAGSTITFSLASSLNVATEYRVAGTKVVSARNTGWTASTGTANKGAYATYAGQDCSAAYVEAEAQATDDAVKAVSQRLKAIEDALRSHGLIN